MRYLRATNGDTSCQVLVSWWVRLVQLASTSDPLTPLISQDEKSVLGLLPRWHISWNITMLRLISFNMDRYWAAKKAARPPIPTTVEAEGLTSEKVRQIVDWRTHDQEILCPNRISPKVQLWRRRLSAHAQQRRTHSLLTRSCCIWPTRCTHHFISLVRL